VNRDKHLGPEPVPSPTGTEPLAAHPGRGTTESGLSKTSKRLQARLRGLAGKAIADFRMIEDGDRVMVCLSGGKDSYTLLDILLSLQRSAPVRFDLVAVNLDQKQPGFPAHVLPEYLTGLGVPFHVIEQDTYRVVKRVIPEGRTMCGLCSRLRRGALYRYASENGITKIALGHHRDDVVETFFLNLFFGGRLKAMPPKLLSEDGRHIVIRPLAYAPAREIERYARARQFPIIPCSLCGSQDHLQRVTVRRMLAEWEREHPGRTESIFSSLGNVATSHLADPRAFDFGKLEARRLAMIPAQGTTAAAALGQGPESALSGREPWEEG
jgi:tRNA 2-thiocytidine biosynthesis protein TtcA